MAQRTLQILLAGLLVNGAPARRRARSHGPVGAHLEAVQDSRSAAGGVRASRTSKRISDLVP